MIEKIKHYVRCHILGESHKSTHNCYLNTWTCDTCGRVRKGIDTTLRSYK